MREVAESQFLTYGGDVLFLVRMLVLGGHPGPLRDNLTLLFREVCLIGL